METCKTLGADRYSIEQKGHYFMFSYCPDKLILIYGFTNDEQSFEMVNDRQISKVIRRVNELKEKDFNITDLLVTILLMNGMNAN